MRRLTMGRRLLGLTLALAGLTTVEADRVKAGALAELEQEVNRAKEALRGQVASLAVAGAEKILARNIDASAQADLVEKLVAEL